MPAPPPPPPMAPAALSPPVFKPSKSNANERDALLKSIRKGKALKKTYTNDKSAPMIGGIKSNNNGMNSGTVSPIKSLSSIQMELKKQLANDNRHRGPPPPTPNRNFSMEQNNTRKEMTSNSTIAQSIELSIRNRGLQVNSSTLHRKARSNANLTTLGTGEEDFDYQPIKPAFNSGKPNLAPKPPNAKLNPNQKRGNKPVSRTHSLKSPRSPSPENHEAPKFGTVRHMSSVISQSLANSSVHNSRSRPAINTRPTAPPPSIPLQHTTSAYLTAPSQQPTNMLTQSKTISAVKPNHAPPPPPQSLPQAPAHAAPPPPPHKIQAVVKSPLSSVNNPPPPPPRHSSMREPTLNKLFIDLDGRFKDLFNSMEKFPEPPIYRGVIKLYNSKQLQIIKPEYVI